MRSTIQIIAILILLSTGQTYAQYFGSVPFLNYPVSAQALGMGGVGTAFVSDNATATIANPAQLGIFSLNGMLNASTDLHNSLGPPYYGNAASLYATGANAGFILNSLWAELPVQVGVGVGYSHLLYNSEFILGGAQWPSQMTGASNGLSFGIGLEDFLRIGIGYTLKWINSPNPNFFVKQTGEDVGAIVQVPVSALINGSTRDWAARSNGVEPVYNFTLGYAMRNLGKYEFESEYLPTEADLGWSLEAGLRTSVTGQSWEWLSVSWSNQAGASPFYTDSTVGTMYGADTVWDYVSRYQKGFGHFGVWQNLAIGKGSQTVGVRKGGQIGLGEFIYIRAGAITDAGQTTYSTFGWGLRLDGLAKCLVFFKWLDPNAPVAKFLLDHLDVQYDYSRAYGGIYDGKPFEDLNLVVR